MRLPIKLLSWLTVLVGVSLPVVAQAFSQDEISCTGAINQALLRAIARQSTVNLQCLRSTGRGSGTDLLSDCVANPRSTNRVEKLIERMSARTLEVCESSGPAVGPDDPSAVLDAARLGSVGVLADVLGEPIDDAVATCAADQRACLCQRRVSLHASERFGFAIKSIALCLEEELRRGAASAAELGVCLSTGANDPNLPVGLESARSDSRAARRTSNKLERAVRRLCEDRAVTSTALAGKCSAFSGEALFACMETALRCRACTTVASMGGITSDCDVFDDGATNGSCVECGGVGQPCCPDASCTSSLSCCGGFCRDTEVDANHCGACDNDCDDSVYCNGAETCVSSSCVSAGDPCPGTDCLGTCDEATQTCYDPVGTECGSSGEYCHELGFCAEPTCGDGVAIGATGEECDDAGESSACDADCTIAECGDGVRNFTAGESCDDAGESATCDPDCTVARCGDGFLNVSAGESCDPGQETSVCNRNCTFSQCGDGVTNPTAGESCDHSGESASCDSDCTAVQCGDGVTNSTAGESCDDAGESSVCDADCTIAECGDGVRNFTAGESCDDAGESATCDPDCTVARCGDGFLNVSADENCDHGQETGVCNRNCTFSECGDGTTNPVALEQCDDGEQTDRCDEDCTYVLCGDGLTNQQAGEECDEGGATSTCNADCTFAGCGDGRLQDGEECDPGGETATCDSDCTAASCGDGTVNGSAGEDCDDGGATSFCTDTCGLVADERISVSLDVDTVVVAGTSRAETVVVYCDGTDVVVSYTELSEDKEHTFSWSAVTSIEFHGGLGNDVLTGTSCNLPILANGGEGDDELYGGTANDTLEGGLGQDDLYGYDGNDILCGYLKFDDPVSNDPYFLCDTQTQDKASYILGEEGDDTIGASNHLEVAANVVSGGRGKDKVAGGWNSHSVIYGGDGDDRLWGGFANDTIRGGKDDDKIFAWAGDDSVWGDGCDGTVLEVLCGTRNGKGSDDIDGDEGNDKLRGGGAKDHINGGPGEDLIYGGDGDDELHGGQDDDELHGNYGKDKILGGKGDDELWGGGGVDELIGAPSGEGSSDKDLCVGGAGSDLYTRCDCQAFQDFFGSDTCN